jgi:hypothetical protein
MEERECEYAGKCAIPCSKVIELGNLMASMQTTLDQVHEDLYNHGKEGMKTVLQTFIAEYKQGEREIERNFRNHAIRKRRIGLIGLPQGKTFASTQSLLFALF